MSPAFVMRIAFYKPQKSDLVNLLKETSFNNFVYKKYEGTTIEEQNKYYERLDQGKEEKELEKSAPADVPIYFYHPDHLGTTNALTDANGNMYQFFLNLPFGELSLAKSPKQLKVNEENWANHGRANLNIILPDRVQIQ